MYNKFIKEDIQEKIKEIHSYDEKQLEIIFSKYNKLLVEAPAGCGKTKIIISKIAYIIASEKLANPKKILALTFSVNAAYKMKKDIVEQLPGIIDINNYYPLKINEKVYISNYHGFARHVLRKYGYLIHENLKNIDYLSSVDDSNMENLVSLNIGINTEDASDISDFNKSIKDINIKGINLYFDQYIEKVKINFLNNDMIPYNAILILAIDLLNKYEHIKSFYQGYFPIIIVDEFQDTNILSWTLLLQLINDKSNIIFMGDPLQRIYGFIGAIPNLMEHAEKELKMKRMELTKNYRFKDNVEMLLLDKNIRANARNVSDPDIIKDAMINLFFIKTQEEEVTWICDKINELIDLNPKVKISILVKQRSKNMEMLITELQSNGIEYFFGLFKDDDYEYIKFHRVCIYELNEQLKADKIKRISKSILNELYLKIENNFREQKTSTIESLLSLLDVFFKKLTEEYSFLNAEEKVDFMKDTFENNALKQYMEGVNKNVVLATIHGSKGLEWDYVIMPDMEQFLFPNYYGLCGSCNFNYNRKQGDKCVLIHPEKVEDKFLDELSVFYVGVTRAREQIFFSASKERYNYKNESKQTYISCMLNIPGIVYEL